MIKAIHAIMTNRKHHIYGEAVTRVFSLLINLHSGNIINYIILVSKITTIINVSKEVC